MITLTGRHIPNPPPIRLTSSRVAANDCRLVDTWLKEQAIAEAEHRGDPFARVQFQLIDIGNMTTADKDCANVYLFGEPNPEVTV